MRFASHKHGLPPAGSIWGELGLCPRCGRQFSRPDPAGVPRPYFNICACGLSHSA